MHRRGGKTTTVVFVQSKPGYKEANCDVQTPAQPCQVDSANAWLKLEWHAVEHS